MPVAQLTDIPEIAHSYCGPEFGWWKDSTFTFCIIEALRLFPKDFLKHIFHDDGNDTAIVSVNYVTLF